MYKLFQRSTSTGIVAASMHKLYKTIDNEVEKPLQGVVKGTIPSWVNGSLYRNGPGMYEIGEHKFNHWFDGMAILQRFHITNGNVTYQRKYLRSDTFCDNMAAKRITHNEFATAAVKDPCKNIFQRFLTTFETHKMSDNTDVNIIPLKDDLYAATETMYLNQIDPQTLDKVNKFRTFPQDSNGSQFALRRDLVTPLPGTINSRHLSLYAAYLYHTVEQAGIYSNATAAVVNLVEKIGVNLTTAHPHWDADGNMYNIGHSFHRGLFTVLVAVPPKKDGEKEFPQGQIVYKVQSPWKVHFNYHHSFSMTENYFVFVQQPLLSNVPKILLGRYTGSAYASSLTFYPEIKSRFRIVDRKTGQEVNEDRVFEADSFFSFHQINAYEEQGHVIIDLSCHKDAGILDKLYMKNLTSEQSEECFRSVSDPEPRRYVIPLDVTDKESAVEDMVKLEHTTAKCKRIRDKTFHLEAEVLADTDSSRTMIASVDFQAPKRPSLKIKHTSVELPQINYQKYNGKKYRYIYGVGHRNRDAVLFGIVKIDANTKTYIEWKEERCYPSEPVFIPNPGGVNEDDGVLMSAVNRSGAGDDNSCFLLVLDAQSFKELARVEFEGVGRFPRDFHGVYKTDRQ